MIKISCEFPDTQGHEGVVEEGRIQSIANVLSEVQGVVMASLKVTGEPEAKIHVENIPPSLAAELADLVEAHSREYLADDQCVRLTMKLNDPSIH